VGGAGGKGWHGIVSYVREILGKGWRFRWVGLLKQGFGVFQSPAYSSDDVSLGDPFRSPFQEKEGVYLDK